MEPICIHEAMHMTMPVIDKDEPSFVDAMRGSESADWKHAINKEFNQIESLDLPFPLIMPTSYPVAGSFAANQIVWYKACLVAKGFWQQFGVNYMDTFAPTIQSATLHILLALAAAHIENIIIKQADVKNTYQRVDA